jgi:hypothetical protein
VLRPFRRAGTDGNRTRGALVHGRRQTFTTELGNSDVSVYTLMTLFGHESMVSAQRYVTAAGTETRIAARLDSELARIPYGEPRLALEIRRAMARLRAQPRVVRICQLLRTALGVNVGGLQLLRHPGEHELHLQFGGARTQIRR